MSADEAGCGMMEWGGVQVVVFGIALQVVGLGNVPHYSGVSIRPVRRDGPRNWRSKCRKSIPK